MATIRVSPLTHQKAAELAERRDEAMSDVVAAAVERLWREDFWDQVDEGYRRLRADPVLWQQELEERAEWQAFDPWEDE
jgi:predicted transcriptional regulator